MGIIDLKYITFDVKAYECHSVLTNPFIVDEQRT